MSDTDGHGGRPHGLLAALVLADIAFAFQQTAIVPAVQAVRSDLGASQEWSSWLITVYLMIATAATPAMGRLADLYGRRRLLAVGLVVFGIGSVGAALAPGIGALVGFRAVQGIGGPVYPATLALARQSVRDDRVSAVVALVAGAFGAGTVLGFACGGVLADYLSWRAVFAAGALGVGVGLAAVARYVPRFDPVGHGRFDAWGTVTLAAASSSLLAALTLVVSIGPAQPRTIGLFVLAAGSAVAWLALQWRRDDPLVDLRAMAKWSIVRAHIGAAALGWALFGAYLLVPEFAQAQPAPSAQPSATYGLGVSAAAVGFLLLPLGIAQMLAGPAAGWLVRRVPVERVFAAGLVVMAGALVGLAAVRTNALALAGAVAALGVGAGLALQTSSDAATQDVDRQIAASSSAVNSTVRRLAGGTGGQIGILVLATVTQPGGSAPRILAFTLVYWIAAGLCLGGAIACSIRRR